MILRLKYTLLFVFAIFLFSKNSLAINKNRIKIDSLLSVLPNAKEDTFKVMLLNNLASFYRQFNPDSGILYCNTSIDLANKLNWEKGKGMAYNNLAGNYQVKANFPKASECNNIALAIFEKIDDMQDYATTTGNIGIVYAMKGDYTTALEYFLKALKIFETLEDKKNICTYTNNIGNVYKEQGDFPQALVYYFKSLKLAEELQNKFSIANTEGNIGSVYEHLNDYTKALEYDLKSLKILEEIGNKNGATIVLSNIGAMYKLKKDYPNALDYYFKSLKMAEDIGDKKIEANINSNIGDAYSETKNYVMAIEYIQKAIKMEELIGDKSNIANSLAQMGKAYLTIVKDTAKTMVSMPTDLPAKQYIPNGAIPAGKAARLQLSINYLNWGLDTAIKINMKELIRDINQALAEAYQLRGDYKKAMDCYKTYYTIRDSIFSETNEKKIIKTAMQYEYDKKQLADSLKNVEKEKIAVLKLERQRGYTIWSLCGIIGLITFSFFIVKERKKSDGLLLNILPKEVANELKEKGTAAAKHFNDVTVLFTDFVGFTKVSEILSPQELIDELHNCFKKFDEITTKYKIEKIKTIGDAYLAVAGLPTEDANHAENIVKAAKEIIAFMQQRRELLGSRTFEIRVGIHSGKVVAGIVGVRKFAYDIWGDTVNTAARMEQNSTPGKINISQTTYDLLKDKYTCTYRGEIEAKNKGKMSMYFID